MFYTRNLLQSIFFRNCFDILVPVPLADLFVPYIVLWHSRFTSHCRFFIFLRLDKITGTWGTVSISMLATRRSSIDCCFTESTQFASNGCNWFGRSIREDLLAYQWPENFEKENSRQKANS